MVDKRNARFGHKWTELKLDAVCAYATAYLKIMSKYPYFTTIYFDGFAGPGYRQQTVESSEQLSLTFDKSVTNEFDELFPGSPNRILDLPGYRFDHYVFVDIEADNVAKLNELKSRFTDRSITIKHGDCSTFIPHFVEMLKSDQKYRALVFLDPFGLQVDWAMVSMLAEANVDLWVLLPTGFTIDLSIHNDGIINGSAIICRCLGVSEPELKDAVYRVAQSYAPLFNDVEEHREKVPDVPNVVAGIYVDKLKGRFKHVVEQPLELWNSRRCIFHLFFASNNPTAAKIASDISRKYNAAH